MMGGSGKAPEYLDFGVRIIQIIRTLGNGVGISPRPALSTGQHHPLVTVQASDIHRFGGPNGIPATGANILSRAGRARRRSGSCAAVRPGAGDLEADKLVAIYENVGQAVLQYEVEQRLAGGRV